MPNYRQKNRNRNKNKNRNKQQQQQQQQQQQHKQDSKTSAVTTTADDTPPSTAHHPSIAVESPAPLEENVNVAVDANEIESCCNDASSLNEQDVITCGTVSPEPVTATCNQSPSQTQSCNVEPDEKMGNEKSKLADSSAVEPPSTSTTVPTVNREVPLTPRQQAKVIVHRIVCDESTTATPQKTETQVSETSPNGGDNQNNQTENASSEEHESVSAKANSESESEEVTQKQVTVIVHQIHLEKRDSDNDNDNKASALSPVHIEEVGDESLTDVEELKSPIVSEVDSAAEWEDGDFEETSETETTSVTQREKRKQKRIALENHFLPQMLNPRFLDSISEENSDISECGENPLSRSASAESAANNTTELKGQKLNAKFPKSSLDFSKTHKHMLTVNTHSNQRNAIREEPLAFAVEARFQDSPAADESCTMLRSFLSPESELAEMVFINSASSSMSDLNEMDVLDRVSLHSASSAAFGLDTDARDLINKPGTEGRELKLTSSSSATEIKMRPINTDTDTIDDKGSHHFVNNSSRIPSSSTTASPAIHQLVFSNADAEQHPQPSSMLLSCGSGQQQRYTDDADAQFLLSDTQARSLETSCDSVNTSSVSSLRADKNAKPPLEVLTEDIEKIMNSVRDILNTDNIQTANANGNTSAINCDVSTTPTTTPTTTQFSQSTSQSLRGSPPPPPIPPPPKTLQIEQEPLPLLVQNVEQHNGQHREERLLQLSSTPSPSYPCSSSPTNTTTVPPASLLSSLTRQESLDSHCSDSTTFSQCTAINVGPNHNKASDHTSSISDLKLNTITTTTTPPANREDAPSPTDPKKLRLLCTETLASLPFGGEVLEELATLAQNIGEVRAVNVVNTQTTTATTTTEKRDNKMPYPLPELPHIDDLQLCLSKPNAEAPQRPSSPNHPDSWLGVPTSFDPKVLVCLSPSQRTYIEQQQQQQQQQQHHHHHQQQQHIIKTTTTNEPQKPDDLLDAHQKFVERRGYHEYTKEQLAALEQEKMAEQQLLQTAAIMKKLRKSITPPPPQIPPPPVPAKSSETAAIAQNLSKRSIAPTSSTTTTNTQTIQTNDDVTAVTETETTSARCCDGEENKHRLLSIIQDTSDSRPNHGRQQQKVAETATSSFENNSRQTKSIHQQQQQQQRHPATPQQSPSTFIVPITLTNGSSAKTYNSFPPTSSGNNMQSVESSLGEMFPTLGSSDIFDKEHKRFSNIESSTSHHPLSLMDAKPKRYSSVETRSFESQKRIENGQVVHDFSNSKHERQNYGDALQTEGEMKFPSKSQLSSGPSNFSSAHNPFEQSMQSILKADTAKTDDHEIMSALKLNKHSSEAVSSNSNNNSSRTATTITSTSENSESKSIRDEVDFVKQKQVEEQQKQNATKERMTALRRGIEDTYEEFRQRAKESAIATANVSTDAGVLPSALATSNGDSTNVSGVISSSSSATTTNKASFQHDHEKLFKEFDDLSKQLHKELETSKTQREQKERSASLFDLNRIQLRQREQIEEFNKQRHEHMKELEREIDRSLKSRQQRFSTIDRTYSVPNDVSTGRAYEIPIQMENGYAAQSSVNGDEAPPPVPEPPRTYQIPIQMENTSSGADDSRFRRAESMFNLNEDGRRVHTSSTQQRVEDDWTKYASDLGSSENIARPFAREVEICYQRRPGGIRAPRLTASTNDLSYNSHSYDQFNAYNVRRSQAPMLHRAPQQTRPQYGSCYSMIERDPNPKYISTTTRRGVSPAPQPSGFHPMEVNVSEDDMRQRRASLPRELHEQQLKYIMSKEEELRTEFERLQNERRRLMEEASRAATTPTVPQVTTRPMRETYRCVPKLPTLTEDEVFRQQMAEEWLNKVAEREKRRLHNIIKISKLHEEEIASDHKTLQKNLGDEFLNRVKERRSKLAMPADSDWESGAESHPVNQAQFSETEDVPPVKILEGDNVANLRSLPRHLREFAKFSNHERDVIEGGHREQHQEEERSQETTDNTVSKAFKKSTVVKTVKTLRAPMLPENGGHVGKWHCTRAKECHIPHRSKDYRNTDRSTADVGVAKRSKKQTRFTLPASRRSWSESDLLQEIDQELKLAKGFLFQDEKAQSPSMFAPKFKAKAPSGSGIWSPKNQTPSSSTSNLSDIKSTPPTPPPPPSSLAVWTPQQSPQSTRKEYRPVHFESPTLSRRRVQSTSSESPLPPPWNHIPKTSGYRTPNSCTNLSTPPSTIASEQDSTEFIPFGARSASVSDKIKRFERSASASDLYARPQIRRHADSSRPLCRPNEVIYNVKYEYMSEPETENDRPRKMAQLGRRQYDGIGPMTNDGMPIILRSEVKEPHQHEWYKRLYQTIHKQKHGGRVQGKANGYQSEPEPSYDSDYSTVKYRPVNSQRLHSVSSALNVRSSNDKIYGTLPNPVRSGQSTYKNQPGRIEDYVTGHSSVSEKETKQQLDQAKLSSQYTEGNLSRALAKESGYTSDSNLVFRKKELPPNSPLSPVEQKQAYKSVQAGGEPPLFGFRKPAPEKSKDYDLTCPLLPPPPKGEYTDQVSPNLYYESDVNIHFKTPVRQEYKSPLSEEELTARQAEQMQKLYQEERRRKYLQELQDMNSRRHTDNFTPSQKSPIALNRYDDFPADLAPKAINQTKSVARALYNFQAQNSKELSFKKGDVIYIRRAIDKNWYEGEHNAMIGLFPANYVEVINKETVQPIQSHQTIHRKPSEGQARAKYNFQAQSGVELSLNKGELVSLTRRVDDNWFEGRIANRKGIFPVSYVEVLTDIGAEDIAARTTTVQHVSTVSARPSLDALRTNINNEFNTLTRNGVQAPNSILRETRTNQKTDILHVDTSSEPLVYRALYKYRPQNSDELELFEGDVVHVLEKCDDGWYVGTSQRTGCFGTFPGNYVERL